MVLRKARGECSGWLCLWCQVCVATCKRGFLVDDPQSITQSWSVLSRLLLAFATSWWNVWDRCCMWLRSPRHRHACRHDIVCWCANWTRKWEGLLREHGPQTVIRIMASFICGTRRRSSILTCSWLASENRWKVDLVERVASYQNRSNDINERPERTQLCWL